MQILGFSKRLLSLGLLCAGIGGATGCGGDYALFDVHPHFDPSVKAQDRQLVERCRLYITDEKGNWVVNGYQLESRKLSETTFVGCSGGGNTPSDLGHLSYSSARSSGSLKFEVKAFDAGDKVLFSGSSDQIGVKVFHGDGDIALADFLLKAP
jgi:hypothetical protein